MPAFVSMIDRDKEIRAMFDKLLGQNEAQQADWLDRNCPDPKMRQELEQLLDLEPGDATPVHAERLEPPPATASTVILEDVPDQFDDVAIDRCIGRGGMGDVYLGRQISLDRQVAVKLLRPGIVGAEEMVARFEREARILARLDHPAIVPVHHVGVVQGRPYILMGYIQGETLGHRLDRWKNETARTTDSHRRDLAVRRIEFLTNLAAEIADALDHAHRAGVIHRDVKPSNILIDEDGRPFLTDFGIAADSNHADLTIEGSLLGTYRYMSPEQAAAVSKHVDARTDVYSLGVVLYEAISLQHPCPGGTEQQILQQVLNSTPPRLRTVLPSISRDLETIVQKSMEKERHHRYQSAAHLAADLRSYQRKEPILARRASMVRRTRHWAKKHRYASFVISVIAIASIVVTGWIIEMQRLSTLCHLSTRFNISEFRMTLQKYDDDGARLVGPIVEQQGMMDKHIDRGMYRLTVISPNGTRTEFHVDATGDEATIVGTIKEWEFEQNKEVQFSGGQYQLGYSIADLKAIGMTPESDMVKSPFWDNRIVRLHAFAIDKYEVSNDDYLAFVESGGCGRPAFWPDEYPDGDYPADFGSLPVVGVTRDEAIAYANSIGKRLPTADEWEAAVRHPDNRPYPWGFDPSPSERRLPDPVASPSDTEKQTMYLDRAVPVRSRPHYATDSGVAHMMTNVFEFVENLNTSERGIAVVFKGAAWTKVPPGANAMNIGGMGRNDMSFEVGFRCARTVQPAIVKENPQ